MCGVSGSGGSGCGKSSLAKLLCKHLSAHPYYANMAFVDCTAMRGVYCMYCVVMEIVAFVLCLVCANNTSLPH